LRKQVILDLDVGVDDALAIMLATASPELQVIGITAVSGNVHVDKTSINALKVLEALGISDVSVAKGAGKPLSRKLEVAQDFHGNDGLGNTNLPPPKLKLHHQNATEFLIEQTRANPKKITVIATGPLTNIAITLQQDPTFVENAKELVIMGGAYGVTPYGYGNMNPVAEFNMYVDPEAARLVFKSGIPLTAVGLDITTDPTATLTKELYEQLEACPSARAQLAAQVTKSLMTRYGFVHLHDPVAVAVAADPSLVITRRYHVDVETVSDLTRGQTVADRRDWLPNAYKQPPNTNVCTSIDGPRFLRMFMERITS